MTDTGRDNAASFVSIANELIIVINIEINLLMELFDLTTLKAIGNKLKAKKQTVALAESVTSGLLQFAFSQIPDARLFLQGGHCIQSRAKI